MIARMLLPALLVLGACANTDKKLEDLAWGSEVDGQFDDVVARTKFILRKRYPRGLDPDRTNEDTGEFWTVWDYRVSTMYRETKRSRAHVKVEDLGNGKVRVGVAVVEQLNDNIENPSIIEEARWVRTQRDPETEALLEQNICQRYLDMKPSEHFEEKHREEPRRDLRPDLVDRSKDVNLEEATESDSPPKKP
jgi:hypothetical protein